MPYKESFSVKACGQMASTLLNASYSKSCLNLLPQSNLTANFSMTSTPNLAHAILIVAIVKQANQSFLILRPVLCWQCLLSKRLRGKQACSSGCHKQTSANGSHTSSIEICKHACETLCYHSTNRWIFNTKAVVGPEC